MSLRTAATRFRGSCCVQSSSLSTVRTSSTHHHCFAFQHHVRIIQVSLFFVYREELHTKFEEEKTSTAKQRNEMNVVLHQTTFRYERILYGPKHLGNRQNSILFVESGIVQLAEQREYRREYETCICMKSHHYFHSSRFEFTLLLLFGGNFFCFSHSLFFF